MGSWGARTILVLFLSAMFISQAILPAGGGTQSTASSAGASARDSAAAAAPRAGTGITISDTVLRNNVTRLGINLWGTSQWDDSLTALKNLVPDPGFESADIRSNVLLRADGSNTTAMMQDNWQLSWNNDSSGIGQPAGFWTAASTSSSTGPQRA